MTFIPSNSRGIHPQRRCINNDSRVIFLLSCLFLFNCMHSDIQFIQAAKHSSSSPYKTLAKYLSNSLPQHSVSSIQSALEYLSKSQSTLKSIDGASHEFYQLSHKNTIEGSAGRVERSAGRVGCCADSLLGCELLDWMDRMCEVGDGDDNGNGNGGNSPRQDKDPEKKEQEEEDAVNDDQDTMDLNDRKMVLNVNLQEPLPLRVVVLYEPYYTGGAGMNHGGIDGLANNHGLDSQQDQPARGRYLIIIKDGLEDDLEKTLECLDSTPEFFELDVGLVSGEIASVNRILWMAAQKVLEACCKCWSHDLVEKDEGKVMTDNDGNVSNGDDDATRDEMGNGHGKELDNQEDISRKSNDLLPALHFVGRSLAGGVATLAAILVDGSIPMPPPLQERRTRVTTARGRTRSRSRSKSRSTRTKSSKRHGRSSQSKNHETVHHSLDDASTRDLSLKLHGFGMGRASAVALGAPPSISANIKASFVTSVICGDDIVCRTTQQSMERLRQRTSRRLEGGVLMKQVGWMTDTLSLTLSSLQSHAHGSEGEEARLSIPGRVYLVRPRRYGGGVSSMHEIGRGRDALRAAVLWQLNDVLLSRSLWKHHSLESYITSIDKVGLRTIDTMDGSDAEENDMPEEIFS